MLLGQLPRGVALAAAGAGAAVAGAEPALDRPSVDARAVATSRPERAGPAAYPAGLTSAGPVNGTLAVG
jgi:hypothetical protein